MYRWEITQAALEQHVFAVVRTDSYERATATADTLLGAGLTSLELSLTNPFAVEIIATLRRETGDDCVIGAGSVLDGASARTAADAGARFLASPGLLPEVVRTGHRYGIPVFPGVATATEVLHALEAGADALKLFPASAYSPAWLRDVRAALPQAPLLPSGGVTLDGAPEWIAAGAAACGMGSALLDGNREHVPKRVTELLQRLQDAVPTPAVPAPKAPRPSRRSGRR